MISNVYAVRDNLCGIYMPPVLGDSDPALVRSFGDSVTKGDTPISQHPEDYTLVKLGTFDTETGVLTAAAPVVLCHASDFVKKTPVKE